MKKIIIFSAVLILAVTSLIIYELNFPKNIVNQAVKEIDFKNATYYIDNESIKINGKNIVYFGNELKRDLNNDGLDDVFFVFTKNFQGSGTFYYIAAAINSANGYIGTNSILLGDRIAPQSTDFINDNIIINYADRKLDEPFTTKPSIGVSKYLKIENNKLVEIKKDATLESKSWTWVKTQYSDDKIVEPKQKNKFTITFNENGNFNITTDCNGGFGSYEINDNKISFGQMGSTMMYCEGSQESDFTKSLLQVSSYLFTDKGELVLELKLDSGSIIFK